MQNFKKTCKKRINKTDNIYACTYTWASLSKDALHSFRYLSLNRRSRWDTIELNGNILLSIQEKIIHGLPRPKTAPNYVWLSAPRSNSSTVIERMSVFISFFFLSFSFTRFRVWIARARRSPNTIDTKSNFHSQSRLTSDQS